MILQGDCDDASKLLYHWCHQKAQDQLQAETFLKFLPPKNPSSAKISILPAIAKTAFVSYIVQGFLFDNYNNSSRHI